jgi:ASC-1-like (ASCH) protein
VKSVSKSVVSFSLFEARIKLTMTQPSRTKTLWIKDDSLQQILNGRKTVEVRVGYSNIRRLRAGDRLLLNERYPYRLKRISVYASFADLLAHEDAQRIAPGMPVEQLLPEMRSLYPPEKEALGVVALEIEPEEII